MVKRIKSSRIIERDQIVNGYVYFENDRILRVTADDLPYDVEYDVADQYVSPGFIDIHTHGGNGCDFTDSAEQIVRGCNFHLKHGTTSICPTVSAAPFSVMSAAVREIGRAMKNEGLKSNIIGAHLEGPYLSKEYCGAQDPNAITPPVEEDYKALIQQYPDVIARWTYAPENDTDGKFCKYLTQNNIVASAGHTNALYDDMLLAMNNGCNLVTHLYSCTSTITRKQGFRYLGVIESAMLHDEFFVEIIADGKHLPPELIKLILKIKGTDRVALVTDSLAIAGSDITHGFMLETEFIVEDGVCKLMDRSAFAGSVATADKLIRVMVNEVGVSVVDAVKMMTKVPAAIMGLNKGTLETGKDADIIVFDDNVNISKVFVLGSEKAI